MRVTISILGILTGAVPALAQTSQQSVATPALPQPGGPVEDSITIGIGAGITPSYEGSDNYRFIPAAVLRGSYSGFAFFTRGPQLFVDIIPQTGSLDIELGPVATVRVNRTGSIKDARVRALGELDTAIEVGAFVGVSKTGVITSDFDNLAFRVSYQRDVANAHDGYVITPTIEYVTPLSTRNFVGASVSATVVGDRYADYYFSVTPAGSVASSLRPYSAEGGLKDVTFGLFGAQSLSGDIRRGLSVFAVGSYAKLLGDFKRSPLVQDAGDADQWFGAVGIAYTF